MSTAARRTRSSTYSSQASLMLTGAFAVSAAYTVYTTASALTPDGLNATHPAMWAFYAIGFAMAAIVRSDRAVGVVDRRGTAAGAGSGRGLRLPVDVRPGAANAHRLAGERPVHRAAGGGGIPVRATVARHDARARRRPNGQRDVVTSLDRRGFLVLAAGLAASLTGCGSQPRRVAPALTFANPLRIPEVLSPTPGPDGVRRFALDLRMGTSEFLPGQSTPT